ncbi:DUF3307 domain-containing protein [Clostridium paraputrificum]|uniref:DUF3307 domain-containing protein n=1 Tax=Clostridium paraputrificum TaxID=29363 RepID=UPI003D34729C
MITYILIALISHMFCDFIFQNKKIAEGRFPEGGLTNKNKYKLFKANAIHSFIHIVGIYLGLVLVNFFADLSLNYRLFSIIVIGILHFIIDSIKSIFTLLNNSIRSNIWIFIIDQLLHYICIIIVFASGNWSSIPDKIFLGASTFPSYFSSHNIVLIVILVILISTYGTAYFSRTLLNSLGSNSNDNSIQGATNGGFIIGILERLFIMLGIIIKQPAIIVFVLTLKSIARYNKFKEDNFVEYFIIGTFLSLIVGILGGLIISRIVSFSIS